MQQGLLHLHNFLRWVIIILAVIAILKGMRGMGGGKAFTNGDRKSMLFLMISVDVQLLLGLALYFMNGWAGLLSSGADIMSNKYNRFFTVEHTLGMLISIVLIHIAYSTVKKNIDDTAKFKKMFWFTLVAVIVMLASVPWPFREAVARPLFPGMH
jgi:hypothetical protein